MITVLTPSQVQSLINTMPPLPSNHTNAIVGTLDQNGAQVLASFKMGPGDKWIATGAARHEWSGQNEVGASVIYSW